MLDLVVKVEKLDRGKPLALDMRAERGDRAALAERFGWLEVRNLEASLEVRPVAGRAFEITGEIGAVVVQRCRVTGNPVPESVDIEVRERFVAAPAVDGVAEIDPMAVSVEVIEEDAIPVGEMVAQLVGLEADAWPRDPEAVGFAATSRLPDPGHPFASLAEWKKKH